MSPVAWGRFFSQVNDDISSEFFSSFSKQQQSAVSQPSKWTQWWDEKGVFFFLHQLLRLWKKKRCRYHNSSHCHSGCWRTHFYLLLPLDGEEKEASNGVVINNQTCCCCCCSFLFVKNCCYLLLTNLFLPVVVAVAVLCVQITRES